MARAAIISLGAVLATESLPGKAAVRGAIAFPWRNVSSLDGWWNWRSGAFDPQPDPSERSVGEGLSVVKVPGAFDVSADCVGPCELLTARGTGHYRRVVRAASRHVVIRFGACSISCRIFADGKLLAERGNGYSGFDVALPPPGNETDEDGAFSWELIV